MPLNRPILLVDDEPSILDLFERTLARGGFQQVLRCEDSRQVLSLLEEWPVEVLVLDLTMPFLTGDRLLPEIATRFPEVPVVVATGVLDLEVAVRCMKAGARDYLLKPVAPSKLLATIKTLVDLRELERENRCLREVFSQAPEMPGDAFSAIVTRNPQMLRLLQYAKSIAATSRPVLVTGETGVGKELVARALHVLSGRTGKFVAVNMGGVDDQLFSDTLFGHLKGAYTGADRARSGLIEQAENGTLFLDEIGEMELNSQTKLLRLLQEREYLPLGADVPSRSNARIIAATNRDLQLRQQEGQFRSDLYYRLQVHRMEIPPLRERPDDLALLLDHFLASCAKELGIDVPAYAPELLPLLATYPFPGNVRELEGMVFEAVNRHGGGKLSASAFRPTMTSQPGAVPAAHGFEAFESALISCAQLPTLRQATEAIIQEAMRRSQGKQTVAARILGISQPALSKRLHSDD